MNNKSSGGGMGLLGVLQVIFIVLKCLGLIAWSWWAVLIPLWIAIGFILFLVGVVWLLD